MQHDERRPLTDADYTELRRAYGRLWEAMKRMAYDQPADIRLDRPWEQTDRPWCTSTEETPDGG